LTVKFQGPPAWAGLKRGTQSQAIGKSKGGWTTKILALTDALGNLVRFVLMPGHRFDTFGVAPLIKGVRFDALLADKAFDSNWIIADMNERGALICISQHPRRAVPLQIDTELYKSRHLIENFFCKLKEFKRIAMRADKTDTSFKAMIYAVAALINSR
jgi:transposase